MKIEKLVPDTSVIIEGLVSKWISEKRLKVETLVLHEAVIAELEHQSNRNRTIGFIGLEEINRLKQLSKKHKFEIVFRGRRPTQQEIKYSSLGEIDALIRELAYEEGATLFTGDSVQAKVAEIRGQAVIFEEIRVKKKVLSFEKYFDDSTMSIHLRENVEPFAKRGLPGNWEFVQLSKEKLTREGLEAMAKEIMDEALVRTDGFVEIERKGSSIVQLGRYRIVITKPPFSDGWEITAVKPIKILTIEDYKLSDKLRQRLESQAEGILIAGAPGMGKSTFAQALAMFYASRGRIVKTVEAPRDLTLPETITQYAISHGSSQEVHDILLLSRPDHTIFDEMRNTPDFLLFADLRLAGIGLAGVVHATTPIDAIQRFVGRLELGVIPQVIDTVIFIKNGQVDKVLSLEITVKVPTGMTEADLARPIVVVSDFEQQRPEYELYTYGEETVVIPISKRKAGGNATSKLVERAVKDVLRHFTKHAEVEINGENSCIVYVPEEKISKIIGRNGKNIERIEKKLGMRVDVRALQDSRGRERPPKGLHYELSVQENRLVFSLGGQHANKDLEIFIDGEFLFAAKVGKDGKIKLNRDSELAQAITEALEAGQDVRLVDISKL